MEIHLAIVVLLILLAILDLVVGVSNDAVNFLNSSIGSGVASLKTILTVASIGVLLGASMSSGMMEIARKGIFMPQMFSFHEIMILFFAVMITDVILLDFFNSFKLPTSTTVSIVFELLGAATVIALLKVIDKGDALGTINNYINAGNALVIISGIFLSVIVAFAVGWVIMNVSRLLFSFQYYDRLRAVGGVFAGLCFTSLFYFLLVKGLKGAFFISKDVLVWFSENTLLILGVCFILFSIVSQVLIVVFKKNIFKFIVLTGTFALALSFAGNDLVNFIGVPLAGLESFLQWKESGVGANKLMMEGLNNPVRSQGYLLLIAGVIMVITLWKSSRSRAVGETEVNLARQNEGEERFKPNELSRSLVKISRYVSRYFTNILPKSWQQKIEQQFRQQNSAPIASFDLLRASINLTTASILISIATSFKLPLSTTYVSFMVAMGTSLADRAWDRDSAVYRVAGVTKVIGGWFMTAVIAFSAAFFVAAFVFFFTWFGLAVLVSTAVWLLVRNQRKHSKDLKETSQLVNDTNIHAEEFFDKESEKILSSAISTQVQVLRSLFQSLEFEDLSGWKNANSLLTKVKQQHLKNRAQFLFLMNDSQASTQTITKHILLYDHRNNMYQALENACDVCGIHLKNQHKPISSVQLDVLEEGLMQLEKLVELINSWLESGQSNTELNLIFDLKKQILFDLQKAVNQHSNYVKSQNETIGVKNSILYLTVLLQLRDIAAIDLRFVKLLSRVERKVKITEELAV